MGSHDKASATGNKWNKVQKTYNPLNLPRNKEMQMGERNHLDGENKIKSVYSVGCLLLEVLALKTERQINQSFDSPCLATGYF